VVYVVGLEIGLFSVIVNQFIPLGAWALFTQFAVGLSTLIVACANISTGALGQMIFWYTALSFLSVFLLFLLVPLGPAGVLLIGQLLFFFNGWLMQQYRLSNGCMA